MRLYVAADGVKPFYDLPVSFAAPCQRDAKRVLHSRFFCVEVQPENMHLVRPFCVHLNRRQKANAESCRFRARLRYAKHIVVIRQREHGDPAFRCCAHHLRRRVRAVRTVAVQVQVEGFLFGCVFLYLGHLCSVFLPFIKTGRTCRPVSGLQTSFVGYLILFFLSS
ncbi:hypothetical protein SDC9_155664 [bioreactor metagenome]|uniref:Transmembrane protein n=1 Tax=bioreactor metagenome TaxID=1076179 RepID=A0A645F4D7_9ZZZZ